MTDFQSHQNLCRRENNKEDYDCQILCFSNGKKNINEIYVKNAVIELINYSRHYFNNWEAVALAEFTSYSQVKDLSGDFLSVFWQWYAINYRFHNNVSSIIELYLSEHKVKLDDKIKSIYISLQNSYVSIYQVLWVKNNTIAVGDIFNHREFIFEKDFDSLISTEIKENMLFLARIVSIENNNIIIGKPIMISEDKNKYLMDRINFIKIFNQIEISESYIREHTEVICGMVLDLSNDVNKAQIKVVSLSLRRLNYKKIIRKIKLNKEFSFIEKNDKGIKYRKENSKNLFSRLYFDLDNLIIVCEDSSDLVSLLNDLNKIINQSQKVDNLQWKEGLSLYNQKKEEEIFAEIINDRNLEKWLISPHTELENMTPVQAMESIRGRIFLDKLLFKLESQENKNICSDEYIFPVSLIHSSLNWNKNKIKKELLSSEAILFRVEQYRSQRDISPYVIAYDWADEDYKKIAIKAFDLYFNDISKREKLAWMLFMWNEYSSIYHPQISNMEVWLAALEYIFLWYKGEEIKYNQLAKRYNLSAFRIRKNAQYLIRHFSIYPSDFNCKIVSYPKNDELTNNDKINFYIELQKYLREFSFEVKDSWEKTKNKAHYELYEDINTSARFWERETNKIYKEFFEEYYILDSMNDNSSTIANEFWENQAKRFPPYLKSLYYNIMMSYVGVFSIYPLEGNEFIFEDIFTGNRKEVFGRSDNLYNEIIPGTIIIARLLQLESNKWLVTDPVFSLSSDMKGLFEKILDMLMENFSSYDISNIKYLKLRGKNILRAYCFLIDELEHNTINLMEKSLLLNWQVAHIPEITDLIDLLQENRNFKLIKSDETTNSFIWIDWEQKPNYQWGYLRIENNQLLVTMPPGKDQEKFIADIRWTLKSVNIIIRFCEYQAKVDKFKKLEYKFITDLIDFFKKHTELFLPLLRQDNLADEEDEWLQGMFFLKFGSLVIDQLEVK